MSLEDEVQKDIYRVVKELRNTKRLSKAYEFLIWLEDIKKLCDYNEFNVAFPSDLEEIKNRFDLTKYDEQIRNYCLKTKLDMISYDKKLCKIASYLEKKYEINDAVEYNNPLSIGDAYMLSEEFFKYFDKDIYNLFQQYNEEGRYFIAKLEDARGITMCGNKILKTYVLINVDTCVGQTIDQIFVLVHETIHAYIISKQKRLNKDESFRLYANNLEEVYSLFAELAVAKYLEGIGFNKEDVNIFRDDHLLNLVEYLKDFKKSRYLSIMEEDYSYGYVLAYHFYDQYLKNKDIAKENITNFMLDSAYHDKKYMLNNYGLNEKDILSPKVIEEYGCKNLKRIPK